MDGRCRWHHARNPDEETTWKAHPDWAATGTGSSYSSYLGRQWNQLWLMTAEAGTRCSSPTATFDATAPRWSPDGTAHRLHLERGRQHLALDRHGAGRTARGGRADPRTYRAAVGRLRITVTDAAGRRPVPSRVSVTGPDGRGFAPDGAWRHADDGFDRAERRFELSYFHADGSATVTVPAGPVCRRGHARTRVPGRAARRGCAAPRRTVQVRIPLGRLDDLPARGWFSGDLHVHMNYGGAYRSDPRRLAFQARAEDLHVVENLIVNKESRIPDVEFFRGGLDPVSTATTIVTHDQEYHTSYWGHLGLLGLTDHLVLPGYAGYANTAAASLVPTNADVADVAHAQGGLAGYVHPFDSDPAPGRHHPSAHRRVSG